MNKHFNDIAVFLIILYAFQTLMNVPNNQESVTTTATTLGGHFAAAADQATLSTKTTGKRIAVKSHLLDASSRRIGNPILGYLEQVLPTWHFTSCTQST